MNALVRLLAASLLVLWSAAGAQQGSPQPPPPAPGAGDASGTPGGGPPLQIFVPTEKISADSSVTFPVDI